MECKVMEGTEVTSGVLSGGNAGEESGRCRALGNAVDLARCTDKVFVLNCTSTMQHSTKRSTNNKENAREGSLALASPATLSEARESVLSFVPAGSQAEDDAGQ